jgi:hypothetical protein
VTKRTAISLTGGLGNQLFQLSAALQVANGGPIMLVRHLGGPREHRTGEPDICGFYLGSQVQLLPYGRVTSQVSRRVNSLAFRSGVLEGRFENLSIPKRAISLGASILTKIDFGSYYRVRVSNGVGFDPRVYKFKQGSLLIGYFQTWRFSSAANVSTTLGGPTPIYGSKYFEEMRARSSIEHPLVIHVRMGDYRQNPEFGILGRSYYERSLAELRARDPGQIANVWLFSDEPQEALKMLSGLLTESKVTVVEPPTPADHPATVLSIMSLGHAFILANSTFGYWAASLSKADPEAVSIPEPWFARTPPIPLLSPPRWRRISR